MGALSCRKGQEERNKSKGGGELHCGRRGMGI
jgi:hypothetical protein